MKKTSDRVDAARNKVIPAAEDFVHTAADRVGPLAQSAADRLGAAADRVSPLAHTAADRLAPLAQSAADRLGPLAHSAADRVAPLAHSASEWATPLAQSAADRVTPYAHQAAEAVSPYAERIAPLAGSAKQRGAKVAHDAVEKFGPVLDEALDRVGPAIESARDRVSDDLLPKLTAALGAAAGAPVVAEAVQRGQATLAAARGELSLPEPKKKGRWLKRLAVIAALGGIAFVLARKFLGSKDSDWQAARPSTPYTPPKPTSAPAPSPVVSEDAASEDAASEESAPLGDAGDDPQGGESAHADYIEANGEAEPEQPAEGGVAEAEAQPVAEVEALTGADVVTELAEDGLISEEDGLNSEDGDSPEDGVAPDADRSKYSGEGVYVGSEPPEGYTIKGNERSMKYHLPESSGYVRTIAEVWFNSEEAAQAAGFIRAQR